MVPEDPMATANSHAHEAEPFQRTYQIRRRNPGSAGHLDLDDDGFERVLWNILAFRIEVFQVGRYRLSAILQRSFLRSAITKAS